MLTLTFTVVTADDSTMCTYAREALILVTMSRPSYGILENVQPLETFKKIALCR